MEKVTGIGGVFFKCNDPEKVKSWYSQHLGIPVNAYGSMFKWRQWEDKDKSGTTSWSPFKKETKYFQPSQSEFMINYRVKDLVALLAELKKSGVEQVGEMESHEYGKFAWIMDCEGNKIELWEPVDEVLIDAEKK